MLLKGAMAVLLQRRKPLDIDGVLGKKRVEQRFALPRRMETPLDAEPPGELTTTATATRLETRNARSIAVAWLASETPPRRGRDMMTPSNRSTATTGARDHSRSMGR